MIEYYTKFFVGFWNLCLGAFTILSFAGLGWALAGDINFQGNTIVVYVSSWVGMAILFGGLSIGISAYEKLCRLVELKEKDIENYKQMSIPEKERIEPTV